MKITGTIANNTIDITLPINKQGVQAYAQTTGNEYYDLGPFVIEIGTALTITTSMAMYTVTPVIDLDAPDKDEYALRGRLKTLCEILNIPPKAKIKPERWSHICGLTDTGIEQHRYAKDVTEEYSPSQGETKDHPLVWILRSPIGTASLPENSEPEITGRSQFERVYRSIEAPIISVLKSWKYGGGLVSHIADDSLLFEDEALLYNTPDQNP